MSNRNLRAAAWLHSSICRVVNLQISKYKTEVNPNQTEQIDYLLQRVRAKVATLRQQQQDLAMTIDELNHIETLCLAELDGIKRT